METEQQEKKGVVLCGVLCILIALLKKVEVWEGVGRQGWGGW